MESDQPIPAPVLDPRLEELVFEVVCARGRQGFAPLPIASLRGLLGRCGLRPRDLAALGEHPGELLCGDRLLPEEAATLSTLFANAAARRSARLPAEGKRAFIQRLEILVEGMEAQTDLRFPRAVKTLLVGREEVIQALSSHLPTFDVTPTTKPDPEFAWSPEPMPALPDARTRARRTPSEILAEAGVDPDGRRADQWTASAALLIGIVACAVGIPLALEGVLGHHAALVAIGAALVVVGLSLDAALTVFGNRIFGRRQIL
jgi:hypothetical protein